MEMFHEDEDFQRQDNQVEDDRTHDIADDIRSVMNQENRGKGGKKLWQGSDRSQQNATDKSARNLGLLV